MLIKKRCRNKLDTHLKMLADAVPGTVESICWKKRAPLSPPFPPSSGFRSFLFRLRFAAFRNQILGSTSNYIRNLQLTLSTLQSQVLVVDREVDQLICESGGVMVDDSVLSQIKRILSPTSRRSHDDPQVKMMNQLIGAKAFLVRTKFL